MIACGGSEEFQCLIPCVGKKRVQERAAAHDPVALYTWDCRKARYWLDRAGQQEMS